MILTIILILIIIILAIKIHNIEHFQMKCLGNSVKLTTENSYETMVKGRCTNAYFGDNDLLLDDNPDENDKKRKCTIGHPISVADSALSKSKSFCK